MTNKYLRTIYGVDKEGNTGSLQVDVYDILDAYPTKNPALDHLIKKALCPGQRGHKDLLTDLDDIIKSAQRAKAMIVNKMACTTDELEEDVPLQGAPARGYKTSFMTHPVSFTGAEIFLIGTFEDQELTALQQNTANVDVHLALVVDLNLCPYGSIAIRGNGVPHPPRGEKTLWHFTVDQAIAVLVNDQKERPGSPCAGRPASFKGRKTIYAFPEKIRGRMPQLIEAVGGVCGLEYIERIAEAPAGSVVVGSYPLHEPMVDGRFTYGLAEALEILANDQKGNDTNA